MNIEKSLDFNEQKPAVFSILKTDKLFLRAIGLLENQLLIKHKANIPTFLTVLKGSIEFHIQGVAHILNQFDTFVIPVNVEHEVKGMATKNIFTLTQER